MYFLKIIFVTLLKLSFLSLFAKFFRVLNSVTRMTDRPRKSRRTTDVWYVEFLGCTERFLY